MKEALAWSRLLPVGASAPHRMSSSSSSSKMSQEDAEKQKQDAARTMRACLRTACDAIYVPPNATCPRFLVNNITKSGFGHQFSELLMGMWKARSHGLSYVFEPFGASRTHNDDYSSMNDLLGLPGLFASLGGGGGRGDDAWRGTDNAGGEEERPQARSPTTAAAAAASATTATTTTTTATTTTLGLNSASDSSSCNVAYSVSGYHHCGSPGTLSNCFFAPENRHLFQKASACLRLAALAYGHLFTTKNCVLDRLLLAETKSLTRGGTEDNNNKTVVAIVWHIRYGDHTAHAPGDPFYPRVMAVLKQITEGYKPHVLLVGGGDGNRSSHSVPQAYVDHLSAVAASTWADANTTELAPVVSSPAMTFHDSFVAMAHADILIGSGSSLPAIAALVSAKPLYFAHVPKHGFNHGMEMLADGVDLEANGTVVASVRRLRVEMQARVGGSSSRHSSARGGGERVEGRCAHPARSTLSTVLCNRRS
jgi:hypothetical protein